MSDGEIKFSGDEISRLKDDLAVMISNATMENRISSGQLQIDKRRNLNDECGYPETQEITPKNYRDQYDRNPIAARTVEVFPKECWKMSPAVFEDEDPDVVTPFEEAFGELSKFLREESWYQDDEGNPVWEHLIRTDILSGVGSYGVLLIGIDDGAELSEPVVPQEGMKLLYLRSFDESLVDISSYELDKTNRRYGMPTAYSITLSDPAGNTHGGIGYDTGTEKVHWTRALHIADNLGSSEIFGRPRMQPVFNRLLDLDKLYGGSAEMYYKGAFPGYLFSSDPSLKGDVNWNISTIRNQIEQYFNGLQRYAAVKGMKVDSMSPQVVDPTPQINTQIEAICILMGIPKRIFMGSERGNLASTQDENAWNDRLKYRQSTYVTPRIIIPFVDMLIWMGILPKPRGYSVFWPDLATMTGSEKADIAVKRTKSMADYVNGNVESIMTPFDFITRILGFSEEEASVIVESAAKAVDQEETMTEEEKAEPKQQTGQQPPPEEPVAEGTVANIHKELLDRLNRVGWRKVIRNRKIEFVKVNKKSEEQQEEDPEVDQTRVLKVDDAIINESVVKGGV